MKTFVKELVNVKLKNPVLVEGFPGLGYVGKITVTYIAMQLKAKRLAELYSPYFPYHVITTRRGGVRLPRAQFHYYVDPKEKQDLIFCTSDSQAQSLEGQFDVVETILSYVKAMNAKTVLAVGGYSTKREVVSKPVCVATNQRLLKRLLKAGASPSPLGNPIVGLSGVTVGMAKLHRVEAGCLLGQTIGHLPDPESAKCIVSVLERYLEIDLDLAPLDKEIEKAVQVFKQMEEVQKDIEITTRENLEMESKKVTYIS